MDRWCLERSAPRGAVVDLMTMWRLSGPWYRDRLDEDWKPKTPERIEQLLTAAGLSGDFWSVVRHN